MNNVPTAEQLLADAAWLKRLALTLATDRDEADDLVQESWIAAWERQPTMERSLRPWLAKVVRDLAAMRRRSRQRREVRESSVLVVEPSAPDALLAQMRLHQLIVALVLELEEPFRATILARFVEGRSAAAIARSLGIPASTVRARQREGLARLRARLDERTGERKAWAPAALAFARRPASRPWVPALWLLLVSTVVVCAVGVIVVTMQSSGSPQLRRTTTSPAQLVGAVGHGVVGEDPRESLAWQTQLGVAERRIAGRVVFQGAPVADALVRLASDPAVPASEQRSDREGRFDFGPRAARTYAIGAAMAGKRAAIAHVDLRDPSTQADALELVVRGCDAALLGRVLDPAGAPIVHAQLLREEVIGAESDANGAYELCVLSTALTSDELHIAIRAAGFAGIELVTGVTGRLERDFVVVPEAVLEGVVTTAAGTPAGDVKVEVARDAAVQPSGVELPARVAAATDREGKFRIVGLTGGNQQITAHGRDGVATPVVVAIRAGETKAVSLRLDPTGALAGRVMQEGRPVSGITITAGGNDAVSQADGTFVIEGIVGEVDVVTSPRTASEVTAIVRAGERTSITLELGAVGELHGTVRRHGVPAGGARVMVSRGDDSRGAYADDDGHFVLPRLDAGDYHGLSTAADGSSFTPLSFSVGAGENHELVIDLASGARVAGTVFDTHDDPVAGVSLRFERPGGGTYDHGRCSSDVAGHFACAGLAGGGTYTAQVFAIDHGQPPFRFLPNSQITVDLANGDSRVDDMRIAIDTTRATIRGHVRSSAGLAVIDARITASAGVTSNFGLVPSVVTDADGVFTITDLAPGAYTLAVEAADGATTASVGVATGTTDLEITLDPAGCVPARDVTPTFQPPTRIAWDDRIELVGWDLPRRVKVGEAFVLVTYYKVLQPVGQPWKMFVHLQGKSWINADHDPVDGRCATSSWKPGDILVDRITTMITKAPGDYQVWLGFFRGSPGNWQNLPLSIAPTNRRDADGRLDLTGLSVD